MYASLPIFPRRPELMRSPLKVMLRNRARTVAALLVAPDLEPSARIPPCSNDLFARISVLTRNPQIRNLMLSAIFCVLQRM